ncbi:PAS domain S-box protein, partial [Streptomyces sp. NPDC058272]|uniref:PAS domain S-box protein n=1 Tax=Streptomyces sp. NPDC058272 TaxID=3346415 RepID=UPI0036DFAA3A
MSEERDVPARRRFDVADAAPLLLDARLAVTSWTADAERLLGYPAAEVLGRRAVDLLLPDDAARISELVQRCREGDSWAGLLSALHRDGHLVPLMVRAVAVQQSGGPAHWVVP